MRPIISFPKSGRTWVRYACFLAGLEPEFDHGSADNHVPDMGKTTVEFKGGLGTKPLIFLHRNPLDTAVSYFFQLRRKDYIPGTKAWQKLNRRGNPYPLDIENFVVNACYGVPRICNYNRVWLNRVAKDTASFSVRYEELIVAPEQTLGLIFEGLGADLSKLNMKAIVQGASFDSMKKVQAGPDGEIHRIAQRSDDPESAKIRRGLVRGYTDYLCKNTIAQCRLQAKSFGFKI